MDAKNGHDAVAQLLMEKRVNIKTKRMQINRQHYMKQSIEYNTMIHLLMQNEVNVKIKNINKQTVLHKTIYEEYNIIMQLLVQTSRWQIYPKKHYCTQQLRITTK